jgi:hypothetical protein
MSRSGAQLYRTRKRGGPIRWELGVTLITPLREGPQVRGVEIWSPVVNALTFLLGS